MPPVNHDPPCYSDWLYMHQSGILTDDMIREYVKITPFHECESRPGVISYGLSSMGYDLRVGRKYKVFTNVHSVIVDPKNIDYRSFVDVEGDHCIIPPNSFALAEVMEYIEMPPDVLGICTGKSTIARCGILVSPTPIEPSWKGVLTIEISNTTPLPAKVYSCEGICQVMFFKSAVRCRYDYANKKGIYDNQTGLTLPRVRS